MRIVVTGSSGHLGEGLVRTLRSGPNEVIGVDIVPSPYTDAVGSVVDQDFVKATTEGAGVIVHAATLHKPHIETHSPQAFVLANVQGTLNVLDAAVANAVPGVVFISTTSAFGRALHPPAGEPAAWITEDVRPIPKNIYGVTKVAAEDLCELYFRQYGLSCIVLRTSRFFPEDDDDMARRRDYDGLNLKVNELLYRRVDLADAVDAVLLAAERVREIGFSRYIISATPPFARTDAAQLGIDAPAVVAGLFEDYAQEFERRGWRMLPTLDRVYANDRARTDLGWRPMVDFRHALNRLKREEDPFRPLSRLVGEKGYHTPSR